MKNTHTYLLLTPAAVLVSAQTGYTISGTVYTVEATQYTTFTVDGVTVTAWPQTYVPTPYTVDGVTYIPGPGAVHPTPSIVVVTATALEAGAVQQQKKYRDGPGPDDQELPPPDMFAPTYSIVEPSKVVPAGQKAPEMVPPVAGLPPEVLTDLPQLDPTAAAEQKYAPVVARAEDAEPVDVAAAAGAGAGTGTSAGSLAEEDVTAAGLTATATEPVVEVSTTPILEGALPTYTLRITPVPENGAGRVVGVSRFLVSGLLATVEGIVYYVL